VGQNREVASSLILVATSLVLPGMVGVM
jgi:hypothetical protein